MAQATCDTLPRMCISRWRYLTATHRRRPAGVGFERVVGMLVTQPVCHHAELGTRDAAANDLSNAFNFGQGANTPSQLPNTSGEMQPPVAILFGLALLIGLSGMLIQRKARGM